MIRRIYIEQHYNSIYGCNARSIIDKSLANRSRCSLDRYMDSLQGWGVLASRRVPTFHMAADWILSSHLTQRERKIYPRDDL